MTVPASLGVKPTAAACNQTAAPSPPRICCRRPPGKRCRPRCSEPSSPTAWTYGWTVASPSPGSARSRPREASIVSARAVNAPPARHPCASNDRLPDDYQTICAETTATERWGALGNGGATHVPEASHGRCLERHPNTPTILGHQFSSRTRRNYFTTDGECSH